MNNGHFLEIFDILKLKTWGWVKISVLKYHLIGNGCYPFLSGTIPAWNCPAVALMIWSSLTKYEKIWRKKCRISPKLDSECTTFSLTAKLFFFFTSLFYLSPSYLSGASTAEGLVSYTLYFFITKQINPNTDIPKSLRLSLALAIWVWRIFS